MRRQLTMLVVDDVEVNRASLRAIFEEEYRIVEAADGKTALQRLQEDGIDLIILDLCIPGDTSEELLKKIRADRNYAHIPIIVKTAIDETLEEEVLEAGADDFIFSPCNPAVIRNRIRNIANKHIYEHEFLTEKVRRERYRIRTRDNFNIVMVQRMREALRQLAESSSEEQFRERQERMERMLDNVAEIYETGREYGTHRNRIFSIRRMVERLASRDFRMETGEKAEVIFEEGTIECEYLFGDEEHICRIWENLLRADCEKSKRVRTQYGVKLIGNTEAVLNVISSSEMLQEMDEDSYLVSRAMLEMLGGTYSKANGRLSMNFPVNKGKAPLSQRNDFSSIRLLNVGDEMIYRDYYNLMLKRLGMNYDVAADEKETLQRLEEAYQSGDGFDICIVNWQMETGDAGEIMRKIREKYDKDTLVLVGFAADMKKNEPIMREAGADYVLEKPAFQGTLYQVLSDICKDALQKG